MKKFLKYILYLVVAIITFALLVVCTLTVTEYKPKEVENVTIKDSATSNFKLNTEYKVLDWNIGYAGLDKNADFFMDGGQGVNPESKEVVAKNLESIAKFIKSENADVNFLQEVDEIQKGLLILIK